MQLWLQVTRLYDSQIVAVDDSTLIVPVLTQLNLELEHISQETIAQLCRVFRDGAGTMDFDPLFKRMHLRGKRGYMCCAINTVRLKPLLAETDFSKAHRGSENGYLANEQC